MGDLEQNGEKALQNNLNYCQLQNSISFSLSRENMRTVKICDFLLYFKFSACFRLCALNLFAHRFALTKTCAYVCTWNYAQTNMCIYLYRRCGANFCIFMCGAEKCAKLCSHFPDTGGEMPLQGLLVVSVFNSFDYLI